MTPKGTFFSLKEIEHSDKAVELGIDNSAPESLYSNIQELIDLLDDIRLYFGRPLLITSGYRSNDLNRKLSWSNNSSHTKGLAADLLFKGSTAWQTFKLIQEYLEVNKVPFGQLIYEQKRHCCHLSVADIISGKKVQRKQIFTLDK